MSHFPFDVLFEPKKPTINFFEKTLSRNWLTGFGYMNHMLIKPKMAVTAKRKCLEPISCRNC